MNEPSKRTDLSVFLRRLSESQREAYDEALRAFADDFRAVETVCQRMRDIENNTAVDSAREGESTVLEIEGRRWQVRSCLMKLGQSEIFLCETATERGREFAVAERFSDDSPYARGNGTYELLLRGTDSDRLRHDYVECERQTLRLMATETVAQVHERLAEKMTEQKLKPVLDAVWLTLTNDLPRQTLRQTHEVDSANKRRHRIRV